MTLLTLRTGRLAVDLAPASGGAIARFAFGDADLLRPMTAADVASGEGTHASAYPLVPFSNRIKDGRLVFGTETFHLKHNWPGVNHPMHGDGWSHPWQVVRCDTQSAEIFYEHERAGDDGGWPFRYRARQSYRLEADRLTVALALDNLEERAVPAGLGLHPFFVREADSELQCRTEAVWRTDAEVPTIRWPSRKLRVELEASPAFRHAVIYVPPDRPYFCVEPVSHANGRVGRSRLDAGATLSGEIVFRVEQET